MKNILYFIIFLFIFNMTAQKNTISIDDKINFKIEESLKNNIYTSLNVLFKEFDTLGESSKIEKSNSNITKELLNFQWKFKNQNSDVIRKLINAYELDENNYLLKIAYLSSLDDNVSIIAICSLVAINNDGIITFSSPINYNILSWKNERIGKINYFFKTEIDKATAKQFDINNINISKKLGLSTDDFSLYKCSNYQEVLKIIGIDYSLKFNGVLKSSTMVGNIIFTGLNSEDFSHDIFHFYSSKLFERNMRNWTTEEGLAYSWGNAYYTNVDNEMISRDELVIYLKKYLRNNPKESLLSLFENKPKIFNDLSSKVSVKSTIASLLCDEVENTKGIDGIKELINCGKGDDNFFKKLNELIGINKSNFDERVKKLIATF